ncbi:MAG: hypothetical protein LAN62_02635 [Acidobacteriia bacterium]|nr:hypothetical protein [Terriglobia bacterium]
MGVLTRDLTRLRNEILTSRNTRQRLIRDLAQETVERRAGISRMLIDISKGLGTVAGRTRADRLDSISDVKRAVSGLLTEVRTDLGGIREMWLALGTPSRRVVEGLKGRPGGVAENVADESQRETPSDFPPAHGQREKRVRKKRKR